MEKTFDTKFGEISLRTAIFETDSTNLEEGVEIKLDGKLIGEAFGWRDVEEMTVKEVEAFVEKHCDI